MAQAIITKFIPCTNHRGSRVKAFCDAGNLTMNWDHALNVDENHERVAKALANKLGWEWHHIGGSLSSSMGGYVFVKKVREVLK